MAVVRILVLGGSVFLSRAVAVDALARGHEVTCATRGSSGPVPEGAGFVRWDRSGDVPDELARASYDAVVDVARIPSWVRRGVAAWPDAHWVFVSTVNVYADDSTPGGRPATLPLREPQPEDVDLATDPEAYGPMKVACEQIVRDGAASWTVIRPGLIVGPGDPTGRFTYWPVRLAEGGETLAGGEPGDAMQVIDVRDLAAWIVTCAERRTPGDYDGVGEVLPIATLLAQVGGRRRERRRADLGAAGVPDRAGRRAVDGPGVAAAVAAAARVRRPRQPRPGAVHRRRPGAAAGRRHRARHAGLGARDGRCAGERNVTAEGGCGPRCVA